MINMDKHIFFDRKEVLLHVDAAAAKNLSYAGAITAQSMKRSMRSRKRASKPGQAPSAHKQDAEHPHGDLLKQFTQFAFDPSTKSVVSGPRQLGHSDAPDILEHGGEITTILPPRTTRGVRRNKRGQFTKTKLSPAALQAFRNKLAAGKLPKSLRPRTRRTVEVDARPYAEPALEREEPKFVGVWADSV